MALVGLTVTLAPTIGPTVGGYLTELFSWHWLFLVNVIPGIAATLLAWFLVDFDKPDYGAAPPLRLLRPGDDGGLSRQPRVRARGGAAERLVRTTAAILAARRRSALVAGVAFFCADADGEDADRRPRAPSQPQLRGRLAC